MAIETSRRELARRRAAAVAGVGGLWVALLAALGAWWLALGALVLAAGGAGFAWLRTHGSSAAVAGARGHTAFVSRARPRARAKGSRAGAASARTGRRAVEGTRRLAAPIGPAASGAARRSGAAVGTGARRAADAAVRVRERRPHARAAGAIAGSARVAMDAIRTTSGGLAAAGTARRADGYRLVHASVQSRREGRIDRAVAEARDAVAALKEHGDRHGEAMALNTLALALAQQQRYADAVAALDEALQLLVEAGDRHREGAVLVNLGSLHREAGVVEEARSCWSKALERLDPDSPESQQTERLLRAS